MPVHLNTQAESVPRLDTQERSRTLDTHVYSLVSDSVIFRGAQKGVHGRQVRRDSFNVLELVKAVRPIQPPQKNHLQLHSSRQSRIELFRNTSLLVVVAAIPHSTSFACARRLRPLTCTLSHVLSLGSALNYRWFRRRVV